MANKGYNPLIALQLALAGELIFHSGWVVTLENKQPAAMVDSLREKVMMESLKDFTEKIVSSNDPKAVFE